MTELQRFVIRTTAMLALAVVLTIFSASLILAQRDNSTYPDNFFISGVMIGGLDREQARMKIDSVFDSGTQELILEVNGNNIVVGLAEAGIYYDPEPALNQMDELLKYDDILNYILNRTQEQNIPALMYDENKLGEKLEDIKKQYDLPAKDAAVIWQGVTTPEGEEYGKLDYIGEQSGFALETEVSIPLIKASLERGDYGPVTLAGRRDEPKITEAFLKTADKLLAVGTVALNEYGFDRANNVVEAINGILVLPKDTLYGRELADIAAAANPVMTGDEDIQQRLISEFNELFAQISAYYDKNNEALTNGSNAPLVITAADDGEFIYLGVYGSGSNTQETALLVQKRTLPAIITDNNEPDIAENQQPTANSSQSGQITEIFRITKIGSDETERILLRQDIPEAAPALLYDRAVK